MNYTFNQLPVFQTAAQQPERTAFIFGNANAVKVATITMGNLAGSAVIQKLVEQFSEMNLHVVNGADVAPVIFETENKKQYELCYSNLYVKDNQHMGFEMVENSNTIDIYFDYAHIGEWHCLIVLASQVINLGIGAETKLFNWAEHKEITIKNSGDLASLFDEINQYRREEMILPKITTEYSEQLFTLTSHLKSKSLNEYRAIMSKLFLSTTGKGIDWNAGIMESGKNSIRHELDLVIPMISTLPVRVMFEYIKPQGLREKGLEHESMVVSIHTDDYVAYQFALNSAESLLKSKYKKDFYIFNDCFMGDMMSLHATSADELKEAQQELYVLMGV